MITSARDHMSTGTQEQEAVLTPEQVRKAVEPLTSVGYRPDITDVAMLQAGWTMDVSDTARLLAEFMKAEGKTFKDQRDGQDRLYAWLKKREKGLPLPTPRAIDPAATEVYQKKWADAAGKDGPTQRRIIELQTLARYHAEGMGYIDSYVSDQVILYPALTDDERGELDYLTGTSTAAARAWQDGRAEREERRLREAALIRVRQLQRKADDHRFGRTSPFTGQPLPDLTDDERAELERASIVGG